MDFSLSDTAFNKAFEDANKVQITSTPLAENDLPHPDTYFPEWTSLTR